MSEERKKHKIRTFKQIMKSEDNIIPVDSQTFYVKSESDPKKEPYMVFHEVTEYRDRWLCDCMNFVMNIVDANSPTPNCKHIRAIKERYNIT